MTAWQKGRSCTRIDGVDVTIEWTASKSVYDYSGEWLHIEDARVGHVHLHVNTHLERIQAWILEKWAWEEHFLKQEENDFGANLNLTISKVLQNPKFISTVCQVQRTRHAYN